MSEDGIVRVSTEGEFGRLYAAMIEALERLEGRMEHHREASYDNPDDSNHILMHDEIGVAVDEIKLATQGLDATKIKDISNLKKAVKCISEEDFHAADNIYRYSRFASPAGDQNTEDVFIEEVTDFLGDIESSSHEEKMKLLEDLLIEVAAYQQFLIDERGENKQ